MMLDEDELEDRDISEEFNQMREHWGHIGSDDWDEDSLYAPFPERSDAKPGVFPLRLKLTMQQANGTKKVGGRRPTCPSLRYPPHPPQGSLRP